MEDLMPVQSEMNTYRKKYIVDSEFSLWLRHAYYKGDGEDKHPELRRKEENLHVFFSCTNILWTSCPAITAHLIFSVIKEGKF